MELAEGTPAPDFEANASNGEKLSLRHFLGQWVVLYFYPKDDTPGCTREACAFRDGYAKLRGLNAVVLGCSPDDLRSHDKFITKFDLPFYLLSDTEREVASTYGVLKEKSMYGRKIKVIERSTFLINPDGEIHKIWRRVKVDAHIDEVLDELKLVAR